MCVCVCVCCILSRHAGHRTPEERAREARARQARDRERSQGGAAPSASASASAADFRLTQSQARKWKEYYEDPWATFAQVETVFYRAVPWPINPETLLQVS